MLGHLIYGWIPSQVLTGLYGMNFVHDDGSPNMPELTWEYGYAYFWGLSIVLTVGLLVIMKWSVGFTVLKKSRRNAPLTDIKSWVRGNK